MVKSKRMELAGNVRALREGRDTQEVPVCEPAEKKLV
jgi:hypothetical protein